MQFLAQAFGFSELLVVPGPDGTMTHAEMSFGPEVIMLGSSKPELGWVSPLDLPAVNSIVCFGLASIEEVKAHYGSAISAGVGWVSPLDLELSPHCVTMKTIRLAVLATLLALVSAATPDRAMAHAPRQGYLFLRLHGDSLIARLELNLADLEGVLTLGWDPTVRPTREQVQAQLAVIRRYAEEHFSLADGATRLVPAFRDFSFRGADNAEYLLLEYLVSSPPPKRVTITLNPFFELDNLHRNLVVIEHNWRTGTFDNEMNVSTIHSPAASTQVLDLTSSSLFRGFVALVRLGVWHIWIGLDHILFLVALILPSVLTRRDGRWQPAERFGGALVKIVTIVTFFTIAHTITLSLAALGVVELPSRLVESVIAGSIAIDALHNLWPVARINEAAIAFAFGLFHGFGFATVLGDLGLGTEHLVLSLLGFNLGVEIGQVAIITAIFPILFFARQLRVYQTIMRAGSVALIAIGLLWVAERTMNFNVPLVPIAKSLLGIRADSASG